MGVFQSCFFFNFLLCNRTPVFIFVHFVEDLLCVFIGKESEKDYLQNSFHVYRCVQKREEG